jgi:hypothetical protein
LAHHCATHFPTPHNALPSLSRPRSTILLCFLPSVLTITVSLSLVFSPRLLLPFLQLCSPLRSSRSPCLLCLVCPWELRVPISLEAPLPFFALRLLSLLLLPPSRLEQMKEEAQETVQLPHSKTYTLQITNNTYC